MSWNRSAKRWFYTQHWFINLSLLVITILALSNINLPAALATPALAQNDINTTIQNNPNSSKGKTADDFIQEIFASPVPHNVPPAEAAVEKPTSTIKSVETPADTQKLEMATSRLAKYSRMSFMNPRELLWPMRGGYISSRFGMRWGRMHRGTDIAAPMGTPILAAAGGKVIFVGWEQGYGKLIILDNGHGVKTKYGHCSAFLVKKGELVHQGDIIGKVGRTGDATGPHLHFEVIREGIATNPEKYLHRWR